jgi:hypothetical protein
MSISKSPERNTFQQQSYLKKLKENPEDQAAKDMIDLYKSWNEQGLQKLEDPEWQQNNMEYDLRSTEWILEKVRESRVYAQHLYAAICNNDFQKLEVLPILKNETWTASWRSAGGIISDMREEGDYIDWYCSGIRDTGEVAQEEWNNFTEEQKVFHKESQAFVSESVVTDEIREDLKKLGWAVVDQNNEF